MDENFCHVTAKEVDGDIFLSFYNSRKTPRGLTQVEALTPTQFYGLREKIGLNNIFSNGVEKDISLKQYELLKKHFDKGAKNESQHN